MSTITHVRPKKELEPPSITSEEVMLKAPPVVPHKPPATGMQRFGPIFMLLAVVGIVIVAGKSGMFSRGIGMMLPVMLVMGMVMMMASRGGDKKQEIVKERADYLRYLDNVRDAAIEAARNQFAVAEFHYPRPQELVGKIGATSALMWRRRGDSREFMHARIGLGTEKASRWFQRLDVGAMEDQEPACVQAVNDLIHEHSFVRDIPRPISLAEQPAWALMGDADAALAGARAMLAHLAFFHGPDDLMIAVVVDEDRAARWDAVKWLPHHRLGAGLLTFGSVEELMEVLGDDVRGRGQHVKRTMKGSGTTLGTASGQGTGGRSPVGGAPVKHLVVLCDSATADWDQFMVDGVLGREATTVLDLTGQCPLVSAQTTLHFSGGEVALAPTSGGAPAFLAVPDAMSASEWEAFVRKLSRYRQGRKASRVLADNGDVESSLDLMELLNVSDAANWDPGELWKWASTRRNRMRVPVGRYLDSRRPWIIDLKEGFHGPHFGVGGGTGGGKSDFLRTFCLALCMTHSPEDLVITPADFKGRKTFAGFERLPHVLVVLNNLDSSPDRVARLRQVFQGEIIRRQKLLELAGDGVNDIEQYRAFRRKHPERNLPPMPYWYVPFDELMQAKREAPELLAIMKIFGTVMRSLGGSMTPVTQTFAPGLMEGIDPHLTGRLAMRMHRTQDYRDVLGTASPGALPKRPGVGYFVEDSESSIPPQRVEVCFARKPYVPPAEAAKEERFRSIREHFKPRLLSAAGDAAAQAIESTYTAADLPDAGGRDEQAADAELLENDAEVAGGDNDEEESDDADALAHTVMAAAIDVLERYVRDNDLMPDYKFWLPELTSYTPVNDYVTRFVAEHGRPGPEDLVAPAGVVDLPRDLAQDVLQVPLGQNVMICGGPVSGKSLALASVVLGAAQMYSPERVQFYVLDNGGGNLQFLENLAHVGEVVRGTGDRYAVDRLFTHIWSLFREREASWAMSKVELGQWRRRRFGGEAGEAPDDGYGDIYFVIDQADTVCAEFPEHKDNILLPLAKRGPGYGIHLIFTQPSKQSSGMHKFADDFRHLFELKMADSMESQMMRQNAEAVPNFPGRGLIAAEGTGGARKSTAAAMANVNESIPPDAAHHILFAAPRIGVGGGELAGVQACQFVNDMYPGAVRARSIPQLPDRVMLRDLAPARRGQFRLGMRESDLSTQYWTPEVDGHLVVMGDAKCGKTTTLRTLATQLDAYVSAAPVGRKPIVMVFDLRETLLGAIQTNNLAPGGYVYRLSQVREAVEHLKGLVANRASDEVLDQDELLRRRTASSAAFEGPEIFILIDDYEGFVQGYDDPFDPLKSVIEMGARSGVRLIVSHAKDQGVWQMNRGFLPKARVAGAPVLLMSDKDLTVNLVGRVKGMVLPAGRGLYIERDRSMMVQAATLEEEQL
ncbi:FtsK/SpoIIIE domain-containing protein [Mycolicibacterium lutetiense]